MCIVDVQDELPSEKQIQEMLQQDELLQLLQQARDVKALL